MSSVKELGDHYIRLLEEKGANPDSIASARAALAAPSRSEGQANTSIQGFRRRRTLLQWSIQRRIDRR